jgi:hypothetical protein
VEGTGFSPCNKRPNKQGALAPASNPLTRIRSTCGQLFHPEILDRPAKVNPAKARLTAGLFYLNPLFSNMSAVTLLLSNMEADLPYRGRVTPAQHAASFKA